MAYVGLVASLPIGQLGFTGSRNPTQHSPAELTFTDGLDLDGGILQKEGGAAKLNTAALGGGTAIRAGVSWTPVPGTYHTIAFASNGSVYRDAGLGTFPTTLASGLNNATDPPPMFVAGGGEAPLAALHMFMFSGTNQVKEVTGAGATMQNITTPAADWAANFPTFGAIHANRLWGGGNENDPHRLYYSQSSNHNVFTGGDAGTISIYPGEAERLVGAISYRGVLVIFKYPAGIYVLDTRDPVPANWIVSKLTLAVGAVNGSTIVQIDNDVLFLDSGGHINALSAANIIGDMTSADIGEPRDIGVYVRSQVNLARLQRCVGLWYPIRHQAWFMFPAVGEDDCSIRMIIDLSNKQAGPRFLWSRRDRFCTIWIRKFTDTVRRPVGGDLTGFIWTMDMVARNKGGAAYPMHFETSSTDLAFIDPKLASLSKTGDFLEIVTEPTGNWYLTVEVYWDDNLVETKQYSAGFGGSILGSMILDTGILAGTSVRNERQRISGSGRRLRLAIYNQNANEDIKVSDFILSFRPMDERGTHGGAA